MTIQDFKRDIKSRICRYASLGEADKALPVQAVIHISEVIADEQYPAIIFFTDGINIMSLSQIQSIELEDDHYNIVCGSNDALRTCVVVHFGDAHP